jgi:hypothetical protein
MTDSQATEDVMQAQLCVAGCGFFGCVPRRRAPRARDLARRRPRGAPAALAPDPRARAALSPPRATLPPFPRTRSDRPPPSPLARCQIRRFPPLAPFPPRFAARRNAATANMCSVCYKSHTSKKQAAAEPASSPAPPGGDLVEKLKAQQATPAPGAEKPDAEMPLADGASAAAASPAPPEAPPPAAAPAAPVQENHGRCFACNKRVGLTGFKCRCEYTFCATHRHANKHECAFDWKGMGRETVAKANQKVVADKMEKVRGRRRPTRNVRSFCSRARVAALASEPSTRSADPTPSSPRTFSSSSQI